MMIRLYCPNLKSQKLCLASGSNISFDNVQFFTQSFPTTVSKFCRMGVTNDLIILCVSINHQTTMARKEKVCFVVSKAERSPHAGNL